MSKYDLAQAISRTTSELRKIAAVFALSLVAHQGYAQSYAETPLPSFDATLGFGSSGIVQATKPGGLLSLNIGPNTATGTIGNSWSATASGSVTVRALIELYAAQAYTTVSAGSLKFGSQTSGVIGPLLDVIGSANVGLQHTVSKTIATTGALTSSGATRFSYEFDLLLNNGLLGLNNAAVLDSLHVSVWSGSTQLASGSVFASILGLASITNSSYTNAKLVFDYNPASGPLEVRWSSNILLNASLLELLTPGGGANDIYTINGGSLNALTPVPVPEPSSLLLCAIGLGLILRRGRSASSVA